MEGERKDDVLRGAGYLSVVMKCSKIDCGIRLIPLNTLKATKLYTLNELYGI